MGVKEISRGQAYVYCCHKLINYRQQSSHLPLGSSQRLSYHLSIRFVFAPSKLPFLFNPYRLCTYSFNIDTVHMRHISLIQTWELQLVSSISNRPCLLFGFPLSCTLKPYSFFLHSSLLFAFSYSPALPLFLVPHLFLLSSLYCASQQAPVNTIKIRWSACGVGADAVSWWATIQVIGVMASYITRRAVRTVWVHLLVTYSH